MNVELTSGSAQEQSQRPTLAECVRGVSDAYQLEADRSAAYWATRRAEALEHVVQNHPVIPALLRAALAHVSIEGHGEGVTVELGERPESARGRRAFAAVARAVRGVVGDLKVDNKAVRKVGTLYATVRVVLVAVDYPSIKVRYFTRVPRKADSVPGQRCRIVTTKHRAYVSHAIVCETDGNGQ